MRTYFCAEQSAPVIVPCVMFDHNLLAVRKLEDSASPRMIARRIRFNQTLKNGSTSFGSRIVIGHAKTSQKTCRFGSVNTTNSILLPAITWRACHVQGCRWVGLLQVLVISSRPAHQARTYSCQVNVLQLLHVRPLQEVFLRQVFQRFVFELQRDGASGAGMSSLVWAAPSS